MNFALDLPFLSCLRGLSTGNVVGADEVVNKFKVVYKTIDNIFLKTIFAYRVETAL